MSTRGNEGIMPATTIESDRCGIETGHLVGDDDGIYYCRSCDLAIRAESANDAYQRKKEWLETTHLKDLAELKATADELERMLRMPNTVEENTNEPGESDVQSTVDHGVDGDRHS